MNQLMTFVCGVCIGIALCLGVLFELTGPL